MSHNFEAAGVDDTLVRMVVGERLLARYLNWSSRQLGVSDCVPGNATGHSTGYRYSFGDCSCLHDILHADPFCLKENTRYEEWVEIVTRWRVH
jgi:hypothetical protein